MPIVEPRGVGVLGWLGFFVLNIAACGIIGLSTTFGWQIGFTVICGYTVALLGMASCLHQYEKRYYYLEDLLWLLGCTFVFVCGAYISVNVVRPWRLHSLESAHIPIQSEGDQIQDVLLSHNINKSTLLAWALNHDEGPFEDHINFAGFNFFGGFMEENGMRALLCSDTNLTSKVDPGLILRSRFVLFRNDIYFLASEVPETLSERSSKGLYKLTIEGAQNRRADLVKVFKDRNDNLQDVRDLVFEAGKLYFKASDICSGITISSVFQSDGSAAGTIDLRGPNPCDSIPDRRSDPERSDTDYCYWSGYSVPRTTLWSIICLGDIPMMVLASLILSRKRSPGVFVNIYYGLAVAIILLYLVEETNRDRIESFLKWFITLYTAVALVAIASVSLLAKHLPIVLELLKDWVLVVAGIPFFLMVHIDFDIPSTKVWYNWLVYCCIVALHMLLSMVVQRTLPMVLGAFGAFVLAWQLAVEIERAIFHYDEFNKRSLIVLALLALQGVVIIVGAVFYSSQRAGIEDWRRNSPKGQVVQRLAMQVPNEFELTTRVSVERP